MKRPITKAAFNKWLKKQEPEREFNYCDNSGCLIASFLRETRLAPKAFVYTDGYCRTGRNFADRKPLPKFLLEISTMMADMSVRFTVEQFNQEREKL